MNNGFEAFPLFAVAVIVGLWQGGSEATVNLLALAWLAARTRLCRRLLGRPPDAALGALDGGLRDRRRDLPDADLGSGGPGLTKPAAARPGFFRS